MRLRSFLSEKSWMQLLVDSKASKMPTICLKQPVMGETESMFFFKSRRETPPGKHNPKQSVWKQDV